MSNEIVDALRLKARLHRDKVAERAANEIERLDNENADLCNDLGYAKSLLKNLAPDTSKLAPKAQRFLAFIDSIGNKVE